MKANNELLVQRINTSIDNKYLLVVIDHIDKWAVHPDNIFNDRYDMFEYNEQCN